MQYQHSSFDTNPTNIMTKKEKLEKKIDEMYDFYNDVFVKKYKDRNDLQNQLTNAFSLFVLPHKDNEDTISLIRTHKILCLEIEKHLVPYSQKENYDFVEISEKRLRLIDPLMNFLFSIKDDIEERNFNFA